MTEKKSTTYTAEFKESAVRLAVESDQSVAETAKELGINTNTLHTWIGRFHRSEVKVKNKVVKNDEHIYDELKRLRKENTKLKEERSILKKAAAFFAKECP